MFPVHEAQCNSLAHFNLFFCVCVCQHEKYTSQLQVGVNPLEFGKAEQTDEKASDADVSRSRHEKSERKSNTGNLDYLAGVLCLPRTGLSGGGQHVHLVHHHHLQYVFNDLLESVQLFTHLKKKNFRC